MTGTFFSVVIPVYNQLSFTKGCLDSLLRDSDRAPYEIIVVDNASSDGTREYLEAKARELDRTRDRLVPIFNATNRGVAPAWNQGVERARGRSIGILNNDIVVTQGWFRSMLWAMEFHGLGMVSPFAVNGKLDYDIDARAQAFTHKNLGKLWPDYDFCAVVIAKSTFEKVGKFDENFIVGGYEDQDFAWRCRAAKIRYGVSGAALIHHFGSQTLGEFKRTGDRHVPHNRDYFISKWQRDPTEGVGSLSSKIERTWRKIKLNWDLM